MKIKRYVAWSWADTVIYGAGFIFAVMGAAFVAGKLDASGAGTAETYGTLAVPAAWALISWWRYVVRKRFADSITFVTHQGVQVIPGTMNWVNEHRTEVAESIETALSFWGGYYGAWDQIEDYMNGGTLIASPGPVQDPRNATEHEGGATIGNEMHVNADRPAAAFLWDLTHEAGHVCMEAVGEKREHHAVMAEAGWRYGL